MEGQQFEDNKVAFSVDSGLIDRLGRELVGKPETALSELIKNAYDADARNVTVKFFNTDEAGGTIVIEDDGVGMLPLQLKNGFMRISSTDKVHNPSSDRLHRSKAGRKGIGRFATQRLGKSLTIITQTLGDEKNALQLKIDWNRYVIDTDLTSITHDVEIVPKIKPEGTKIVIDNLREPWLESAITRVYRYVSDLLQPDYLGDRSKALQIATSKDPTFKVSFIKVEDTGERTIADPDKLLFDKALATIEGYVDSSHDGYCIVKSNSLTIDDEIISIKHDKEYIKDIKEPKFQNLSHVHFKVYFFIFQRELYYTNITKQELRNIQNLAEEFGGLRLYRNGFRVLPYGEPNDDWLKLNKRQTFDSGALNIPFNNKNLFGFVEILDPEGIYFQETASREGLIENESYIELVNFIQKCLDAAKSKLRYGVDLIKKSTSTLTSSKNIPLQIADLEQLTFEKLGALQKNMSAYFDAPPDEKNKLMVALRDETFKLVEDLKSQFMLLLDELGMLRVLAALGLTIGEFTHEVVQFSPSMTGDLTVLGSQSLDGKGIGSLENLQRTIQLFVSYTSYFNATVSANVSRELKPQKLDRVVKNFADIIVPDISKVNTNFEIEEYGYQLVTVPMHASEWSSILFNLYTNSKKAIKRKGVVGHIKVVIGPTEDKKKLYLEFLDNGDGIPEGNKAKVFDAFFTTSEPSTFDGDEPERLTGTGLGLKIVKDIIQTYGGTIDVIDPENGFATCFRIELPIATEKQREEYGL